VNLHCRYGASITAETPRRDSAAGAQARRALDSAGSEHRARLPAVSRLSPVTYLRVLPGQLRRSVVDVDYYKSMGVRPTVAERDERAKCLVRRCRELARKFPSVQDVLSHISARSGHGAPDVDVLRLYEKWLRTGSPRDADGRLVEIAGLVPNRCSIETFYQ
jgi:hypothetical protein